MHLCTAISTYGFIQPAIFTQNSCLLDYEIIINNHIARDVNQGSIKKFDLKFSSIEAYFEHLQKNRIIIKIFEFGSALQNRIDSIEFGSIRNLLVRMRHIANKCSYSLIHFLRCCGYACIKSLLIS